ncbi:MAG: GNAT family N-acyltransferase [Lysobacterales bacterium]
MHSLQTEIIQRWPHWFAGARARLTRPLLDRLLRYTRLDRAEAFLAAHPHLRGLEFVEGVLRDLDVRYQVDDLERQRIPLSGACVIVANHPLGGLDALALLKLVGDLRRDVHIVANDWLCRLQPLRELLLPVRVFGGRSGGAQLDAIDAALAQGAAVIVFPAAEVSRLSWRGIRDRAWRQGFVRFAARHQAPVLPVRVQARNSIGFYAGAALASPLGTALLPRELYAPGGRRIEMRIARPWSLPADADQGGQARGIAARVQQAVERLRRGRDMLPARAEAIAHPLHRDALVSAIATLDVLGETADGKRILLAQPGAPSIVLREIARLRELTFRAVGEGTGTALDWDRFDAWYDQIVLWDSTAQRIVGAYRVGRSAAILAQHGKAGLYTHTLFDFDPRLDEVLGSGLELGRSFVVPDYWGSRSLDYLWYGIGAYLRRYPDLRWLFGTVSISAALPRPARDHLVGYYQQHHGGDSGLVRAHHPYPTPPPHYAELDSTQAFRVLRDNLQQFGARVPTLYKQYTELCEPGGARFLAFGVDPDFNDAVDGLILVDLQQVTPRKRERYLVARTELTA